MHKCSSLVNFCYIIGPTASSMNKHTVHTFCQFLGNYAGSGRNHSANNHDHVHNVLYFVRRKKTLSTAGHVLVYWMPPAARITELALVMQVARFQQSDVIEIPAASDQSNVVHASLAICVRHVKQALSTHISETLHGWWSIVSNAF